MLVKRYMGNYNKSGFSVTELVVVVAIISAVSFVAIPNLFCAVKDFQLKENTVAVQQAISETRSIAIKKSKTVIIDFNKAAVHNGEYGGLIEIKNADDSIISQVHLDKNILYNSSLSTIVGKKVIFNYHGQPIDEYGQAPGFNLNNNKVTVSFYRGTTAQLSKNIKINPYTGKSEIQ